MASEVSKESLEKHGFPVLYSYGKLPDGCPKYIKLSSLSEDVAQRNHDQTLGRLAARGGLSPREMIAVIAGKHWSKVMEIPDKEVVETLKQHEH